MNENIYALTDFAEIPNYINALGIIAEELINGIHQGGSCEFVPYASEIISSNLKMIAQVIEEREQEYARERVSDENLTASQYLKLKEMLTDAEIEKVLSELGKEDLSELSQHEAVIAEYEHQK